MGYIEPQKTKKEVICTTRSLFKLEASNWLWELDITYVWYGIDG